jgi:tRNA threonylcarbamoyladenosine biosynthesis protein TsaE
MVYMVNNLGEMDKVAAEIVANLKHSQNGATVVGLYGDLGSGKTTFTQSVARMFGITENVVSPTFVIEKIYELGADSKQQVARKNSLATKFCHLIHIDAYRIESSDELIHLGWHDIVSNPENLILIEWPERVSDIMPEHIKINFSHVSESERTIEITKQKRQA